MDETIIQLQQRIRERAKTAPLTSQNTNSTNAQLNRIQPVQVSYHSLKTAELQKVYNKIEAWCLTHQSHPRFLAGRQQLVQISRIIVDRIRM